MPPTEPSGACWSGRALEVEVLYSHAGVATQILVRSGEASLLLDCGDGALRELVTRGLRRLTGVVVTHGHYDHMGGVWSLLGGMRCVGHPGTVPVVSPPDCEELEQMLAGFRRIYDGTLPYELVHHTPAPGETLRLGPFEVTPFEVDHAGSIARMDEMPRIPAYGYHVVADGERIVYSGDTTETESLEAAVAGADLAILEATFEQGTSPVHLSREYAERVGRTARAHLLIHSLHPDFR